MKSDLFQSQLQKFSSGTTATGIQQAKLITLKVQFPDKLEEQKHIAKILYTIDDKIESDESYLSKLLKVKAGLMQDLLTGKVRVAT